MYFLLSYKLAFAFIKGSDYADTYRNSVAFLVLNPFETFEFFFPMEIVSSVETYFYCS